MESITKLKLIATMSFSSRLQCRRTRRHQIDAEIDKFERLNDTTSTASLIYASPRTDKQSPAPRPPVEILPVPIRSDL